GAIGVERDGGVALNDVVAQFAEDLVVAGAARHGVAAVGGRRRRVRVVEQRDRAVENAGGVRLRPGGWVEVAGIQPGRGVGDRGVDGRAVEGDETRAERVVLAHDDGVIARDHIVTGAAVDEVVVVLGAGDVAAADDIIVAVAPIDRVISLLAEDDLVCRLLLEKKKKWLSVPTTTGPQVIATP